MKQPILYRIIRPIIKLFTKIFLRPKIIKADNIPENGRIILAGTHTNIFDSLVIMSSTRRTVHFLAKIELIKGFFGFFFKNLGIIPVDRSIKDTSVMPKAEEYLNNDKVIGIFPEGTINRTEDKTMPFKTGAVRMAYNTNTKIIPFVIMGKYKLFKGPTVVFGESFIPNGDFKKETERLRKIIEKMMEAR